eukprot:TRINITY_DN62680_c0_g1_i1.p1 TRINITY_DN62680_c0_g1~~TRINITY_DN62680_c0_g1_i1.p1  ORF type:complete len:471 (+),score=54.08 TRINITY_DN62680_c0_g1_i1:217-1629(+)
MTVEHVPMVVVTCRGSDSTRAENKSGGRGVAERERRIRRDDLKRQSRSLFDHMSAARLAVVCFTAAVSQGDGIVQDVNPRTVLSARWIWIFQEVGLEPNSIVSFDLHNSLPSNDTFLLLMSRQQIDMGGPWSHGKDVVPDDSNSYFISTWRTNFDTHVKASFQLRATHTDGYYLAISNTRSSTMSLEGSVKLLGPGGEQLTVDYRHKDTVALASFFIFVSSSVLFLIVVGRTPRRASTPIHVLIALVIFLLGLTALLEWHNLVEVSTYGTKTLLGSAITQFVALIQNISELMMLLMIAFGWRILRQQLNPAEVRFAVGICGFTLYLGTFELACSSEATCNNYHLSRDILQSICYLVVIVAMNLNLQMMTQHLQASPASIETGNVYIKFRAYRTFRWIVLAFVLIPTFEITVQTSVLPRDAPWMQVALHYLTRWILYGVIACYFRPHPKPLGVFELTRGVLSDDGETMGDE